MTRHVRAGAGGRIQLNSAGNQVFRPAMDSKRAIGAGNSRLVAPCQHADSAVSLGRYFRAGGNHLFSFDYTLLYRLSSAICDRGTVAGEVVYLSPANGFASPRPKQKTRFRRAEAGCLVRVPGNPATISVSNGLRPEALRPTFSSGLPFSSDAAKFRLNSAVCPS